MSGTRAISTTSRRELSLSFFFSSCKARRRRKFHAILTETLDCFLPGRAKDLSSPLLLLFLASFGLKRPSSDQYLKKKKLKNSGAYSTVQKRQFLWGHVYNH